MKRKSKNHEAYELIAALSEHDKAEFTFQDIAEANQFRRTILIYLKNNSPDMYTTSVFPKMNPDSGQWEHIVVVYNYPKKLDKTQEQYGELNEPVNYTENRNHESTPA